MSLTVTYLSGVGGLPPTHPKYAPRKSQCPVNCKVIEVEIKFSLLYLEKKKKYVNLNKCVEMET